MAVIDSSTKDAAAAIALEPHPNICGSGETLAVRTTHADEEEAAPFRDAAKEIVIGSVSHPNSLFTNDICFFANIMTSSTDFLWA